MKLNRRTFALLIAGALSLGAADAFGGVPVLPPGAQPPAGYAWCPRCEGRRHVPSGFLGWTSKPCPNCNATGMIKLPPPPPPKPVVVTPPPPKPVVVTPPPQQHHHKPAPAVHHKPVQQHHHSGQRPGQRGQQQRPGQQPRR